MRELIAMAGLLVVAGCISVSPVIAEKGYAVQYLTRVDGTRVTATSYGLVARDGRVCEVSVAQYTAAKVGEPFECLWVRPRSK